jgi:hypothetical protein
MFTLFQRPETALGNTIARSLPGSLVTGTVLIEKTGRILCRLFSSQRPPAKSRRWSRKLRVDLLIWVLVVGIIFRINRKGLQQQQYIQGLGGESDQSTH